MAHCSCSFSFSSSSSALSPMPGRHNHHQRFQAFKPAATAHRAPRQQSLQCRASIVSKSTLPDEFKEQNGYKLQFVVFSRLAPEQTTTILKEHLADHEQWLEKLGDQLAFHGPFLNAEASYYGSEMYAVLAESAADARQLVEQDPLHSKGIRKFELMSWVQKTD